jgi:aspartate racemase
MAGVLLHRKIIEHTVTDGTDQSHFDVIHFSLSRIVPDRTEYLVGTVPENPATAMADVMRQAASALANHPAGGAVAGVPCNTFHAPEIFAPFEKQIRELIPPIEVVNMVHTCVDALVSRYGSRSKVGVVSTTGTRNAGIYSRALSDAGIGLLQVPEESQHDLHDIVYNRNWGLKAVSPATKTAQDRLLSVLNFLLDRGAVAIVLGCTEFPLGVPGPEYRGADLVDPLDLLAEELVRRAESKDT